MLNSKMKTILIVDDTPENIDVLDELLHDEYQIKAATSGKRAIKIAQTTKPDIILLDIMMPEMDGYEVCRQLKADEKTASIPIIFVTAKSEDEDETKGLELGAVDYITKPFSPSIVLARIHTHLSLKNIMDHLEELVDSRTKELALTQDATILCLASLAETRDNETGRHILRTQHYLLALAKHLKKIDKYKNSLDDETIIRWYKSAPLHDVGKVGVPDYILLKPSHLTESEFNTMKGHARLGKEAIESVTEMLGDNSFLNSAAEIAYTHHEKWDGTGYPRQLKGDDIPLSGRLMAVADVYDALVCKRCYKAPFSHEYAKDYLLQGKGTHFDPDIIDAFLVLEDTFQEIAAKYPD